MKNKYYLLFWVDDFSSNNAEKSGIQNLTASEGPVSVSVC